MADFFPTFTHYKKNNIMSQIQFYKECRAVARELAQNVSEHFDIHFVAMHPKHEFEECQIWIEPAKQNGLEPYSAVILYSDLEVYPPDIKAVKFEEYKHVLLVAELPNNPSEYANKFALFSCVRDVFKGLREEELASEYRSVVVCRNYLLITFDK